MKTDTFSIICPACNNEVRRFIEDPVVMGCHKCWAVYDLHSNGKPGKKQTPLVHQITEVSPKWMKPGARINYRDGEEYMLHEVMLFSTLWNEYDSEDGWTNGIVQNLEYYFVSPTGKELCITEDDGKLFVRESVNPVNEDVAILEQDDRSPGVIEYGSYQLCGFIGQDDEPLDRSAWQYKIIASSGDIEYEWKKGALKETLQCFRFQSISKLDLERMLIREKGGIYAAQAKAKELAFYRDVFGYAALLLLFMLIYSAQQGKPLCKTQKSFTIPTLEQANAPDSLSTGLPSQFSMGEFALEKGRAYTFDMTCTFGSSNADGEFQVQIVRESDGKPVNTFGATFFSETGYDDEGAWTEATLGDKFKFKADEAGKYEIFVTVKPDDTAKTRNGVMTIAVYPIMLTRFFLILFLVSTLTWLIYQWQWEYAAIAGGNTKIAAWLRSMIGS